MPGRVNGVLSLGEGRARRRRLLPLPRESRRDVDRRDRGGSQEFSRRYADRRPACRRLARSCGACCGRSAIRPSRSARSTPGKGACGWKTGRKWISTSFSTCRARSAGFSGARGPDSEYGLYTENGSRRCYFDTSAVSHALNEPVYIVEPYAPGTRLADNGLPVFPVYYSNDDDGSRKLGRDSRLTFTAPADGDYLARVTDVRGYGGPDFKYSLTVREPKPDFAVSLKPDKLSIAGRAAEQRLTVALDRIDDFEGEVRVEFSGVPHGLSRHVSLGDRKRADRGPTERINADAGCQAGPPRRRGSRCK